MGTSEPIRELKGGYWREETDVSIVPNLVGLNSNQVRTKSSRTWIQNRVHSSSTLIIFTFTKSLMLMSNSSWLYVLYSELSDFCLLITRYSIRHSVKIYLFFHLKITISTNEGCFLRCIKRNRCLSVIPLVLYG